MVIFSSIFNTVSKLSFYFSSPIMGPPQAGRQQLHTQSPTSLPWFLSSSLFLHWLFQQVLWFSSLPCCSFLLYLDAGPPPFLTENIPKASSLDSLSGFITCTLCTDDQTQVLAHWASSSALPWFHSCYASALPPEYLHELARSSVIVIESLSHLKSSNPSEKGFRG